MTLCTDELATQTVNSTPRMRQRPLSVERPKLCRGKGTCLSIFCQMLLRLLCKFWLPVSPVCCSDHGSYQYYLIIVIVPHPGAPKGSRKVVPIVSILVPCFGFSNSIFRILKGNPKKGTTMETMQVFIIIDFGPQSK